MTHTHTHVSMLGFNIHFCSFCSITENGVLNIICGFCNLANLIIRWHYAKVSPGLLSVNGNANHINKDVHNVYSSHSWSSFYFLSF